MDNRRVCAVLWFLVLGFAVAGVALREPQLALFAYVCGLVTCFVTAAIAKAAREETLVRPALYRITCSALLTVALWGSGLALVPHASDFSRIFGVYFVLAAIVAYRALVARGPSRALSGVAIAMLAWLPLYAFTLMGCRLSRIEPPMHWTELASLMALRVFVLMLALVAAAAMLAFEKRDALPRAVVR